MRFRHPRSGHQDRRGWAQGERERRSTLLLVLVDVIAMLVVQVSVVLVVDVAVVLHGLVTAPRTVNVRVRVVGAVLVAVIVVVGLCLRTVAVVVIVIVIVLRSAHVSGLSCCVRIEGAERACAVSTAASAAVRDTATLTARHRLSIGIDEPSRSVMLPRSSQNGDSHRSDDTYFRTVRQVMRRRAPPRRGVTYADRGPVLNL